MKVKKFKKESLLWIAPMVKGLALSLDTIDITEALLMYYGKVTILAPKDDINLSKKMILNKKIKLVLMDDNFDISYLDQFDKVVYNLGNNKFYARIYDIFLQKPYPVILHDQKMLHFFTYYYYCHNCSKSYKDNFLKMSKVLREYYGDTFYNIFLNQDSSIENKEALHSFNFLRLIFDTSRGVFCHAEYFKEYISKNTLGPIGFSYLHCEEKNVSQEDILEYEKLVQKDNKKLIVSTGFVNPTKHIEKVVNVLKNNNDIASKVKYVIIGSYENNEEYVEQMLKYSNNELKDSLYFLGYQPTNVMNAALKSADLVFNLRYPNTEVCSLSLFEQMSFKKVVIGLNSGIFAEMPEDTIIKLSLNNELEDIEGVLRSFLDIPKDTIHLKNYNFQKIAENAYYFVKKNCTVENYAKNLYTFLDDCNVYNLEKQQFAVNLTERLQSITSDLSINPSIHGRDEVYTSSISNKVYSILGGVLDDEGDKGIIQRKPSEYDKDKEIACDAFKTIGLWIGFAKPMPDLQREGLTMFLQFVMKAILERFPNTKLEIWSYSINEEYVKNSFPFLLNSAEEFKERVLLITEDNYKESFKLQPPESLLDYEVTIDKDNLSMLARNYSKADIFIPFIQYLDNLIAVEKPLFVPALDLVTSENYYDFTQTYPHFKAECMNVQWRATNYVRNNAFLFTISKTVRDNQLLRYITQLYEENTHVFYLPVHAKDLSKINFLPFNKLKEKFFPKNFDYKEGSSLKEDRKSYQYLFYPTQIRPYKNIIGILKAMNILKDEFPNLRLVVTGHENDEIKEYVKENKLEHLLIKAIDVTDDELYSLYKYAALIPAASYYEGGFHLQAYEACHIGVPFCVADIPNTRDLLEHLELTVENCGFPIFNPHDEKDIARAIKEQLLKERSKAVAEVERFKKAFQAQTWEKSAEEYFSMMFL